MALNFENEFGFEPYECVMKDDVIYGPKLNIKGRPVHGLGQTIIEACNKYANNTFQICPFENKSNTFEDFKNGSISLAIHLRDSCGIQPGDIIMSCMQNSLVNCLPTSAAILLGAIPCALDPSLSERDCAHLINLVKPRVIVTDEACLEMIRSACKHIEPAVRLIVNGKSLHNNVQNLSEILLCNVGAIFQPYITADSKKTTGVILFSSGTTGLPKGICLSHDGIYCGTYIFMNMLCRGKTFIHFSSLYWISGLVSLMCQMICGASRLALRQFKSENLCALIEKYKIEGGFIATSSIVEFIEMKEYAKVYDISSFKHVLIGGSMGSKKQIEDLINAHPHLSLTNAYGMTETGGGISAFISNHLPVFLKKTSSSGYVLPGCIFKIVDPNTGMKLKANQKGEICIKTEYTMLGYYKNPAHPFDSDGFVKSGDIGYYDDEGYIYITGRIKEMFKYQSWHIVPASIEGIIVEHPAVAEVVVFGVPHPEDGYWPAAAITIKKSYQKDVDTKDIEAFVAARVVDRQRLRAGIYVVQEMIRTPTGKIQRLKMQDFVIQQNNICF